MTTDATSKISENPKKKKQIRRSDEGTQIILTMKNIRAQEDQARAT